MAQATLNSARETRLNRPVHVLQRRWLALLIIVFGLYLATPFFAPIFMRIGALMPANIIYTFYSTQCHQLPQRSYFLFGEKLTYSLDEINAARGISDANPLTLRQFIGDARTGYKVAFSDRMISLYGSAWLGAVAYAATRALQRKGAKALPIAIAAALVLPLAFDGGTHAISDLWGIAGGFRYSNDWLRSLTNDALPQSFYSGDAWGSFNSLMRLVTGALAGFAVAFAVLPRVDRAFGIKL